MHALAEGLVERSAVGRPDGGSPCSKAGRQDAPENHLLGGSALLLRLRRRRRRRSLTRRRGRQSGWALGIGRAVGHGGVRGCPGCLGPDGPTLVNRLSGLVEAEGRAVLHDISPDDRVVVAQLRHFGVGGEHGRVLRQVLGHEGVRQRGHRVANGCIVHVRERHGRCALGCGCGRGGRGSAQLSQLLSQSLDVGAPPLIRHLERVQSGKTLDALGQLVRRRHLGAFDQDGDDPEVLRREGGLDLEADEVVGLVDPPDVCPGPGVEPVVADEDQCDVALLDLPSDVLLEVGSDGNRVDVHEHPGFRETVSQAVVQPVCLRLTVTSPVRDEDSLLGCSAHCFPVCLRCWLAEIIIVDSRHSRDVSLCFASLD